MNEQQILDWLNRQPPQALHNIRATATSGPPENFGELMKVMHHHYPDVPEQLDDVDWRTVVRTFINATDNEDGGWTFWNHGKLTTWDGKSLEEGYSIVSQTKQVAVLDVAVFQRVGIDPEAQWLSHGSTFLLPGRLGYWLRWEGHHPEDDYWSATEQVPDLDGVPPKGTFVSHYGTAVEVAEWVASREGESGNDNQ